MRAVDAVVAWELDLLAGKWAPSDWRSTGATDDYFTYLRKSKVDNGFQSDLVRGDDDGAESCAVVDNEASTDLSLTSAD